MKYNSSCDCVIAVLSALGVLMAGNKAYKSGRPQKNFSLSFVHYPSPRFFTYYAFVFFNLFSVEGDQN